MNPPIHADPNAAWNPVTLSEAASLFDSARTPWCIGGGWAIDLFLGRQTRRHEDTDVVVFRDSLPAIHDSLQGWQLYAADPPGHLRLWQSSEVLAAPIHDIWCRRDESQPWALQLMVVDTENDEWVYRREPRIRRPVDEITLVGTDQLPYVRPEIQLLFKSKGLRPKDEGDFANSLPRLTQTATEWLKQALELSHPGHPWISSLSRHA